VNRPSALILLSLVPVLAGCLPVPAPGTPRPHYGGLRPEEKIGDSPRKLLHVRESDRRRVVAVLGPPDEMSLDGRTLAYEYPVVTSWTLWFFPFGVTATWKGQRRMLCLAFDERGVLSSLRTYRDRDEMRAVTGRDRLEHHRSYRGPADDLGLPPLTTPAENERQGACGDTGSWQ
jgi:hypothetical protein